MTTTTTIPMLAEGHIVYIQGWRMRATNIKVKGVNRRGETVWSFIGEILDDEELRRTAYHGGSYSWRISDKNLVPEPEHIDIKGIPNENQH
jgi:hypothetical protein